MTRRLCEEQNRQGLANSDIGFSASDADPCCLEGEGADSQVMFENIVINGGDWKEEEGVFTALKAGTYHISWTAQSEEGSELQLILKKNAQKVASCFAEENGDQSCTGSVAFSLEKDDTIFLMVNQGKLPNPGFTTFTGYRI